MSTYVYIVRCHTLFTSIRDVKNGDRKRVVWLGTWTRATNELLDRGGPCSLRHATVTANGVRRAPTLTTVIEKKDAARRERTRV